MAAWIYDFYPLVLKIMGEGGGERGVERGVGERGEGIKSTPYLYMLRKVACPFKG